MYLTTARHPIALETTNIMTELLTRFGLAFHPFRPGVPIDALWPTPEVDAFCRRVALSLADGGFVLVTGDPGTGKSVALRLLCHRLAQMRDVSVGSIAYPQSRIADFYRELGDLFGIPLSVHNRWGGFKALRHKWAEHVAASLTRPVIIIDEAQEMLTAVLSELRILSSREFDSESLLCVVFAGDSRLPERFRHPELMPLGSRIRRRLHLDYASRDALTTCLDHLLASAGNPALMTGTLKTTLAEHAAGNYRVLMNLSDELLTVGAERNVAQLDEALFLDVFQPPAAPQKRTARRGRP
jgi:type II secretory pathway predicted ATPase ExeA